MPRRQKHHHYIYRTTCLVTGKFYVGMHSTDNIDDGYLGSGKILRYSINKHGAENHRRDIVEMCSSRDVLKQREKEIVNETLLADPLNMNLKYGGEGGFEHIHASRANLNSPKFQQYRNSGALAQNGRNALRTRVTSQSECSRRAWKNKRDNMHAASKVGLAAMQTPRAREKRKQTMLERAHAKGERNSQFGTCWVTNGTAIKIPLKQLDEFISKGYRRGRK